MTVRVGRSVMCDFCKQRLATVIPITARIPQEKLLPMGLSPEAATKLWACEPCTKELEQRKA